MLATACSNDEVVKVAENSAAIGFSSFVNNSTRADYDSKNLPANLNVYGVSSRAASESSEAVNPFVVFSGDVVTNGNDGWTYSPLRYWIAGNDYTFAAVAPADQENVEVHSGVSTSFGGITSIDFTNNGDLDLLFDANETATGVAADQKPVDFNLGHLLSRVRFQFDNQMHSNYSIKVTDVKIIDAIASATYTPALPVAASNWVATSQAGETVKKAFSFTTNDVYTPSVSSLTEEDVKNASIISESQNLIPESASYTATFSIVLYDNASQAVINTLNHEVVLPKTDFVPGYSYTFKATVNSDNIDPEDQLHPIEFNVKSVADWTEQEGVEILPQSENK